MPTKKIKSNSKVKKSPEKDRKNLLSRIVNGIALIVFLSSALLLGNIFGNKFFSNKIVSISPTDITKATQQSQQSDDGKTPQQDSTSDAKLKEIFDQSVDSDKIEFTNCEGSPRVARIGLGKQLTLINKDASEHSVKIWDQNMTLGANKSVQVTVNFGKGVGFYGVQCDDKEAAYINVP